MTAWSSVLEEDGPTHATLIDPASSSPEETSEIARVADRAGTSVFLIGGSTDVTRALVQRSLDRVREVSDRPVLLFPSSAQQFARGLRGLLFTVPFNSKRREYIIEEQAQGAGPVLEAGLETVNTAYVIVEPGMTVGEVADADLVPRDEKGAQRVARYAALAEVLRFDAVYLEAGSGAPEPVPSSLIQAADRHACPVIVGGGIRSGQSAIEAARAGANVVVTGTLAEDGELDRLEEVIRAVDEAGPS